MLTLKSHNLFMTKSPGQWFFEKMLEYEKSKMRRVTQTEFAQYIGVSQATLSNWMNEVSKPSAEAALKLAAKFYDYEILDLLDYPNPVVTANDFILPVSELLEQFPEAQRPKVIEAIENTLNEILDMQGKFPEEKQTRVMLIKSIRSMLEEK
jgi:transcriptional regulator with XRE-family HTH domain